jgi:signal transduction histidine kinase
MLRYTLVVVTYSAVSWLLLYLFFQKVSAIFLGDLFLVIDIVFYLLAIYYSGGEQSWLYFILLARVIDQMVTTTKRTLVFAHLIAIGYVLFAVYLAYGEQRPISWSAELAKAAFLYFTGLYISMAARPTERRRHRAAAAVATARQLIVQLKEQSQRLKLARAHAEEASAAKSVFLRTISHELRTPMNIVIGMSYVLDQTDLTDEQEDNLSDIRKAAESLLRLLDDILAFSALDTNKLEVEKLSFDFFETIDETLRPLADRAGDKGLNLEIRLDRGLPRMVEGDPRLLRLVLSHLVSNGIKFTAEGGVTVDVARATDSDSVRIEVTDTGIGFEVDDFDQLCEPFVQADGSTTREYGGAGIGLAIVRVIVERMGGAMGAKSAPGEGSALWFELPLGAPEKVREGPA